MNPLRLLIEWHPSLESLVDWFDDHEDRMPRDEADYFQQLLAQMHGALLRLDKALGAVHVELPRRTGRKEDMSPADSLELFREEDGDWIITIHKRDCTGIVINEAHVQFCTPGSGGGGSPRTFRALNALALAMGQDNADPKKGNRALKEL